MPNLTKTHGTWFESDGRGRFWGSLGKARELKHVPEKMGGSWGEIRFLELFLGVSRVCFLHEEHFAVLLGG